MLRTTWIALILGFWSALYLLDAFLKSQRWSSRTYIKLLDRTGFSVSICQFRCYSTVFNRTFVRLAQWKPHFLKTWFTCGVVFGLIAMLLSMIILSLMVYNTIFNRQAIDQQVLTPVMPGVNLPASQVSYYMLTLLVCGILHEVGHAVAAVREQVRVNGFGIFLLLLYPGAYVNLSTEHLQIISPLRQLRIYCAGVWHNFIIVLFAITVLFVYPWLLGPFYTTGSGVVIMSVTENSAVSGPRGLAVGDPITSVSGCEISSVDDWNACITHSMREQSLGYCMAVELIKDIDTSTKSKTNSYTNISNQAQQAKDDVDCCNITSSTHLCFMYHVKTSPHNKLACLPARTTTDRPMCKLQSDCYSPKMEMACVYPAVDNQTKLLKVVHGYRPPLLFLGHPLDLHYSVVLSNYVPSSSLVPLHLPHIIETFCKYLISLSGALVILNVVPCYALDGQWICYCFVEFSLRSTITDPEIRGLIYSLILLFGTLLLAVNVIMAMWMLFTG